MLKSIFFILVIGTMLYGQIQLPLARQTPPIGTFHREIMVYLNEVIQVCPLIEMEMQTKSSAGREIPVLFIPKRNEWQPQQIPIMLFAQQHGDEPSGKEALLMLIHEIYLKSHRDFPNLAFIIVPMANPDGNEVHQRRNGRRVDLNRNHLLLSEPETRLLHQLFATYQPLVTLDVHEYGGTTWLEHGYIKDLGEQFDCLSNPALPAELKEFALNVILNPVLEMVRTRKVKANRYLITSENFTTPARHSTTDIDDGRNSFGINFTLSFILEGLNGLSREDRIWERAKQQLTVIESFLKICDQNSQSISEHIRYLRTQYSQKAPDSVVIHADYTSKSSRNLEILLRRTLDFQDTVQVLTDYRPEPEVLLKVKRPDAYLIEGATGQMLEMLQQHQITFEILKIKKQFLVESFEIQGRDTLHYENRDTIIPNGSFTRLKKAFPAGTILVPTDDIQAIRIVQMLEPTSFYGLSHYDEYQFLNQGKIFPVHQVISLKK